MPRVETIAVSRGGNKVIINKSDFNPDKDKVWEEKSGSQETKKETGKDTSGSSAKTEEKASASAKATSAKK